MPLMRVFTAVLAAATVAPFALAQEATPPADLPLDALLNTRISTAAKYEQRVTDVPASVTVVTAEDIARNGWHTLADVLASARGVYLTYDHGYTYLGVRGVGLPTDYNNRFLILLNGQPMIDGVSGSIDTGTALAIDLSAVSRIEFVRGPGSVLYGSGAMFGVINLILKGEHEQSGLTVARGSHGEEIASGRIGHSIGGGFDFSIVGSVQKNPGGNVYFREFDAPDTNHGLSTGHDDDDYRSMIGTLSGHGLKILALTSTRTKGVPTAWFFTTFNEREQLTDGRNMISATYDRQITPSGRFSVRGTYDRFDYHGQFPYGDEMWRDRSSSTRLDGDARYVFDVRPQHRLTFGAEFVDYHRATYRFGLPDDTVSIGGPRTISSFYGQSEYQPIPTISITTGVRFDDYSHSARSFDPREAIVWHATGRDTLKLLYGRAFRLPTAYELDYEDSTQNFVHSENLRPETTTQYELVWESRISPEVLTTLSLYDVDMFDLIKEADDANGLSQFRNVAGVDAQGIEAQVDYRRSDGIWTYMNAAVQRSRSNGVAMINSPAILAKAGLSTPTSARLQAALELQYESGRRTFGGAETSSHLLTNLSCSTALNPWLSVSATVKNLFNLQYATPGGVDHPEDTIPQNGRTVLFRVRIGG
jgi:iron complex outermembrane receptor protein